MRVWRRERLWVHRPLQQQVAGVVVAVALTAGIGLTGTAMPQTHTTAAPQGSPGVSVPVSPVPVKHIAVKNQADNVSKVTAITWPSATSTTVALAAPKTAKADALGVVAQASSSPVSLQAVADTKGSYTGPSSAQVKVLPHAAAAPLGVSGVVFTVTGSQSTAGRVKVGLDYKAFAQEYGGNYGSRLSLVELPACALTTPTLAACRKQTPLDSQNQAVAQQVSATVALGGRSTTVSAPKGEKSAAAASAVAASPNVMVFAANSSPGTEGAAGGEYASTSLKPSESWNEGGDSGSYDYTYPITLPGSTSSLTPSVALSYDSQSVDGQTPTANAQSSWVGDGWDTPDSYIEQTFETCSDNPAGLATAPTNADECYDGPILTLSLDGSSTSLVCNAAETQCTEQSDDGAVVTHVDPGVADQDGRGTYNSDYWTITDRNGTTYYFGLNELPGYASGTSDQMTNSVDSEPVYSSGNAAGPNNPCYNSAGLTSSVCTMAYRWHLDYVTNATGQAMSYYYTQTSNEYGEYNGAKDVSYISDSYLREIDYGYAAGGAYGTFPDKVEFTPSTSGRCVQTSCTSLTSSSMTAVIAGTDDPDVPYDLICGPGTNETTCTSYSPSFFSVNRLASITTYQYSTVNSAYEQVDLYTLTQTELSTGDTTNSTLWLESIGHEGMDTSAGGSTAGIPMPPVTFGGTDLPNRVDNANYPALYRYRLTSITSELGATTTISYTTPDACSDSYVTGETASGAETNTESCFPVYWWPTGNDAQMLDWFNSYAVHQVLVADPTGGSLTEETDYNYTSNGGAAWHYDDNEVVKAAYRTYGQFRGYATVITTTGQVANNPQTEEATSYYRGMDGDWSIASGGTIAATVTDSQGGVHTDSAALAGDVLETRDYLGDGGPVETDTITSDWVSGAVQTRTRTGMPDLDAQMTGTAEVWTSKTDSDGNEIGASTVTETDTTYDATTTDTDFGLPTFSYTHTVPANTAYDSCTRTKYAPAGSNNLVGLVDYTETDQVACSGFTEGSSPSVPSGFNTLGIPTGVTAAQVASATQTFYDDTAFSTTFPQTATPTQGLVTMVRQAVSGTPGSFTYQTEKRDTYDSYGRIEDAYNADGNETVTTYTVNAVGLTTGQSVAAPTVSGVAHTTSETFDPTRNLTLTSTDENGFVATETYDALGRLVDVWDAGRPTSDTANLEYAYTVSDTKISGTTTQTLNNAGVYNTSVSIVDSLGRARQTQTPTPQGGRLITDTFYDTRGWVSKENSDYWDSTTTPEMALYSADSDNVVPDQNDYTYDGLGRQVQDISEDDADTVSTTTTVYNGDSTTVIPPAGGTVKTTVTDPLGRTSKLIEYTADPVLTTPANTFTGVFYITGGTPVTTNYGYNAQGAQDETTDNAGDTWSQTYNLLGQQTSSTDPDAGASTMVYDADGNLLQTEDADGKYASYTYDALGRKTAEYDASSTSQCAFGSTTCTPNETDSWLYDNATDVSGVTDAIGQTTTETAYSGTSAYVEQSLGFNQLGESLGTSVTIPAALGTTLGKTWKFANTYTGPSALLASTSFPSGGGLPVETTVPTYTAGLYLPSGLGSSLTDDGYDNGTDYTAYYQVEQTELGNGTDDADITDQYDPHTGLLTDQLVTRNKTTPADVNEVQYGYDLDGLTTRENDIRLGATATAETQCYTYTTQAQLAQAWTATDDCAATPTSSSHTTVGDAQSAVSAYDETWTYNSAGDQASETQYSTATGETQTTTDGYNGNAATSGDSQPTTLTSTSTSTSGSSTTSSTTYSYNADGQQATRTTGTGDQNLTWDNQGQLTAVANTTSNTDSSYIYDASGNLLVETDGTDTTLYLPSEQITVNTSTGSDVSAARYYALPGGATAVRTGTGTNYDFEVASDQHGTNTLYLDSTCQDPTWRQYDPYGNARGTAQTWIDNRGFLNDPDDATTALSNVGARWYDPTTGSFISLDPVLEATDPTQLGGYDYSGNDPVSSSDPSGQMMSCGPGCTGTGDPGGCNYMNGTCGHSDPTKCTSDCNPGAGSSSNGTSSNSDSSNSTPGPSCTSSISAFWGCSEHVGSDVGTFVKHHAVAVTVGAIIVIGGTACVIVTGGACAMALVTGFEVSGVYGAAFACATSGICETAGVAAACAFLFCDGGVDDDGGGIGGGCLTGGGLSFSAATEVVTASGKQVPINSLRKGDKVEAHNTATGKNETETVQAVLLNHDDDLYNLTVSTPHGTTVIHTTSNHPFWDDATHAWVEAGKLHAGDRLLTDDGTTAIAVVGSEPKTAVGWMWDLTISNDHDFYVVAGQAAVLVHNCDDPPSVLYHYTNEKGMNGILDSGQLNPSLKALKPQDARLGDGQYLSDIVPGTKTGGQLARNFLGVPWGGQRFTNYIAIDTSGLDLVTDPTRPGVYLVPNQDPLDISGRVVGYGTN